MPFYTRIYDAGYIYRGKAVNETAYFEFLKWYSLDRSKDIMLQGIEDAASGQGKTLLKVEMDYSSSTLYHKFDVTYYYTDNTTSYTIEPKIAPVIIALIPFIIQGVFIIVGAIIAYYLLKEVKEIIYGPEGDGANPMPYAILVGVVLIGGAMLAKEVLPIIKEVRRT